MDDELRASAVRKLRALADRIEAGDPSGMLFYSRSPFDGVGVGESCEATERDTRLGIGELAEEADAHGWPDDARMQWIDWGIALPLQVCRMDETEDTPNWHLSRRVGYALVDPDTYTGPVDTTGKYCDNSND